MIKTPLATKLGSLDHLGSMAMVEEVGDHDRCEAALAQTALSASPVVELRDLTVRRIGATLTIRGDVQCFYHKQLAQETVRPYAFDLRMVNEVRVKYRRPR